MHVMSETAYACVDIETPHACDDGDSKCMSGWRQYMHVMISRSHMHMHVVPHAA